MKPFDIVELIEDIDITYLNTDRIQHYKKGTYGTIIDELSDKNVVLVEFDELEIACNFKESYVDVIPKSKLKILYRYKKND